MNLPMHQMLKVNKVSQRKTKQISPEDKYILLGLICFERKEIESKIWTGSTQFIMPLAEDARWQLKQNRVEARICFCLFRAFPKICADRIFLYSRSKIMKMLLTSENFESFSGVWFNIVYLLLYSSWRLLSNEHYFQWNSAARTHTSRWYDQLWHSPCNAEPSGSSLQHSESIATRRSNISIAVLQSDALHGS